ncbi:MAG TPA: hypothetical protein VGE27_09280 [Gemmatimonas sp.]|uniref:hypothetical protein n=1 Tax=Gemmatimonas sp. TaxID=1962908 RepID=UPI002ED8693F
MLHSRTRRHIAVRLCATLVLTLAWLGAAAPLAAQIRGRPPVRQQSSPWWISGGASATVLGDIADGATQSRWRFGNDPLWQMRGTIEKATDEFTTIGLAVSYGRVDLMLEPLNDLAIGSPNGVQDGTPGCTTGCAAETELYTAMAQFRSGGGPGFHTFFEAQAGVTAFRNLRVKSTRIAVGTKTMQTDLSGTIGGGFGYTLSPGFAITLVQDFGMGWHAKADRPEGAGRTWRVRNTRASLRFAL